MPLLPTDQGVWQLGKKELATILDACPLVTLLNGRKYGCHWEGCTGKKFMTQSRLKWHVIGCHVKRDVHMYPGLQIHNKLQREVQDPQRGAQVTAIWVSLGRMWKFRAKQSFKNHLVVHAGNGSYKCDECYRNVKRLQASQRPTSLN